MLSNTGVCCKKRCFFGFECIAGHWGFPFWTCTWSLPAVNTPRGMLKDHIDRVTGACAAGLWRGLGVPATKFWLLQSVLVSVLLSLCIIYSFVECSSVKMNSGFWMIWVLTAKICKRGILYEGHFLTSMHWVLKEWFWTWNDVKTKQQRSYLSDGHPWLESYSRK